ncbi:MAG TPA: hypothetical protein ENH99_02955 [Candidatus Pacearchaeota archaeon]|nr:hypothetical protein [Candidatus Pacearchaeota archaeon]
MKKRGNLSKRGQVKGQLKLSFGMIFSIILIIIFFIFAFFAIKSFMGIKNSAETGKFINDLETDIDRVWKSAQSSQQKEYFIPSGVDAVCFTDFEISAKGANRERYDELKRSFYGSENLIFYPFGSSDLDSTIVENIDLAEITKDENPFCLENQEGKINLVLKKDFGEILVKITR